MFKPTLKRSQLNNTTYKHNQEWQSTMNTETGSRRSICYDRQSSLIVPPQLFQNQINHNKEPIFNPLNYQWCPYPNNALEMINSEPQGQFIAKDIGHYQDLFWFFSGYQILLWNEGTNMTKRFQMPQKSQIVSFGELESSSLHFKSKSPIIMVAGCQNFVHLFGLNRQTLTCEDFKFCYQLGNSSYIQRIVFHSKNEIVVVSDTGQHWLFDFKSDFQVHRQDNTFFKKTLPSLPLLFPQSHFFYEKVLVSDHHIVSLVRAERKANWFSYKAKQLLNSVLGENNSPEWIIEEKKIEIYEIDRTSKTIVLAHRIKESELISKCKLNMTQWEHHNNDSQIVSINLKQQSILEISMKSGLFLQIDFQKELTLHNEPLVIPSHQMIGTTGFFLPKKISQKNLAGQGNNSRVYDSLGSDNLTVLGDSLCLTSEDSIELVKNNGFSGLISEGKHRFLQNRSWVFLTNKGFFKVSRLTPKEVVVAYLVERDKLEKKNINKQWTDQNHFQLFIENINVSIGPEKLLESLIELLITETDKISLNHRLFAIISKELQGIPSEHIRDWSYELSFEKSRVEETILLTPQIKEQIWSLIINNGNKVSKGQPGDLNSKNKVVSAYWQALKSLFERITVQVLPLQPKDVKNHLTTIKEVQRLMRNLCLFFQKKREKETRWSNQFYILRKEEREEKQDLFSYFKRKNYLASANKKLEESAETQPETHQTKFLTESSKSLENDILEAIAKINSLIEIFVILSDVSEAQHLPELALVFKSKEAQRQMKLKLLEKLADKAKLSELSRALPQLQMFKDIRIMEWLQNSRKFKFVEMFNLQQISYWLSSNYFKPVFAVFKERTDLQIDLLLHYWARTSDSIALSSNLFELETKNSTKYTVDVKNSLNQNIKYCTSEQTVIAKELQAKISITIRNYISSEEEQYQQAENVLNRTIQLVTSRGDELINAYLLAQLTKTKVTQKVIYFKKLKKKVPAELSIEDRLMKREVTRKRNQSLLETMNLSSLNDSLEEQGPS